MDRPEAISILSWKGGWGAALREAVALPFERETGIRVRQEFHVGLRLPGALIAALDAGDRPPVDVVWCNSVPALRAEQSGHCATLDDVEGLDGLSARAHPGGRAGRPLVYPYVVYYVLVYRQAARAEAPGSWSAMLDPAHRGRVALYPDGNGLLPIAQVMEGGRVADMPDRMDPCWRFVRRLAPQVGNLDYSIGMERLLAGQRLDLCLRALPNALAFQAAGVPVDWCVPQEGTTDTLDALWVPRGLPDPSAFWARQLVAFCLRPDIQQRFCALLGCMPVHPDARPSPLITGEPRLPHHADDIATTLHIPEELKLRCDEEWARRFASAIRGDDTDDADGVQEGEASGSSPSKPPARQIS